MDKYWKKFIFKEKKKKYFKKILYFLKKDEKKYNILPEKKNIFNFLNYTDFKKIKVVILGQDPYHKKGVADGLCFSTLKKKFL